MPMTKLERYGNARMQEEIAGFRDHFRLVEKYHKEGKDAHCELIDKLKSLIDRAGSDGDV